MAKAKEKALFLKCGSAVNHSGDRDYFVYRSSKKATDDAHHFTYTMCFCRNEFEKHTGIKLKKGEVVEITVKRGKTLRKAK